MDALSPLVLSGEALDDPSRALVGGKGANLARLKAMGMPVPPFFVISAAAFEQVLERPAVKRLRAASEHGLLRSALAAARPEGELREALLLARAELGPGPVSVRSSALAEDAPGRSFAGQFDSFLQVTDEQGLLSAVSRCWASTFSERALSYCEQHGLDPSGLSMAVVVQSMVRGPVSGVLFTCDPARPEAEDMLVSAAFGAGEGVVSGKADADTYRLMGDGAVEGEVSEKRSAVVLREAGGTGESAVPEPDRLRRCLDDEQVRALGAVGRELEARLGAPQDVEWSLSEGGEILLLQTRPLTGVGPRLGRKQVWDNSNIIESYSGLTAPLTFTFARRAYEVVYRQFCEVMGVRPEVLAGQDAVFRTMIGRIRGRIYYRLDSWYQVLALLPGFEHNKRFMEQMMGVREKAELGEKVERGGRLRGLLRGLPSLVYLLWRTLRALFGLQKRIEDFHASFESARDEHRDTDFAAIAPEAVVDVYSDLERQLLWNWKAPIINDFYAMIFFGVLKKLTEKHGLSEQGTLHNDLLCGEGAMASVEPARQILSYSAELREDAELRERLRGAESKELLVRLGWPDGEPEEAELRPLRAWLDFYLERYGDRCMDELKLEESTLHDDPSFVLNVLLNYLDLEEVSLDGIEAHEREVRQAAERRVRERLGPLKRLLFGWVLSRARRHIREREGMRLVRTHVFGLVRRMFRGLGDHMARRGVLDHQSDVFWLTTDELFGWVAGTAATEDLRAVAALRRAEQRSFEAGPAPDPRFETFGPVAFGNLYRSAAPPETPEGDVLRGIGCAPGVVRGEARVIAAPSDDLRLSGEILVAERTDPGWVPLYPSVSGILVERGSALSHSAIVARELGIPTVVGIVGLTARVRDGEEVELDGALGTVRIIDESRDAA